jgi:NADPH:quinone reductase-like Zn-dependent oxidoreductase
VDTALSLGGRVIGIGHSSQESYLRVLGVAEFVAYDKENVAGKVREIDVVLNMVDNQADAGMGYLRRGGRAALMLGAIVALRSGHSCSICAVCQLDGTLLRG